MEPWFLMTQEPVGCFGILVPSIMRSTRAGIDPSPPLECRLCWSYQSTGTNWNSALTDREYVS